MDDLIKEKHEKMLYPMVRVRTTRAGGSGTIIYSKPVPGSEDEYETYLFSNFHVVEDAVSHKKEWNPLLGRDVKKDVISAVSVEQFFFEYDSWESTTHNFKGKVMMYDKNLDVALIKIQSSMQFKYVATLFPKGEEKKRLRIFTPVYAVGCGLGHAPLQTRGELAGFDDIIDNYPYWLSTAATFFGSSGGAVFLADTYEYIGIPSRIAVTGLFGSDAITHMSFLNPIPNLYKFLDDNLFQFIYDDSFTSTQCEEMRKKKRERDEKQLAVDISREGDKPAEPTIVNPDVK